MGPARLRRPRRQQSREFVISRRAQGEPARQDDKPLADAEPQVGGLVAAELDHAVEGHDRRDAASREASGGKPDGEAALVREPFLRILVRGSEHQPGGQTGYHGGDVEEVQGIGDRIDVPGDRDQWTAETDQLWTETIEEISGQGHSHERFRRDDDREGPLQRGGAPGVFLIDRIDEQRPAVLHVGHRHHADDAEDELAPSPRRESANVRRARCVDHLGSLGPSSHIPAGEAPRNRGGGKM